MHPVFTLRNLVIGIYKLTIFRFISPMRPIEIKTVQGKVFGIYSNTQLLSPKLICWLFFFVVVVVVVFCFLLFFFFTIIIKLYCRQKPSVCVAKQIGSFLSNLTLGYINNEVLTDRPPIAYHAFSLPGLISRMHK